MRRAVRDYQAKPTSDGTAVLPGRVAVDLSVEGVQIEIKQCGCRFDVRKPSAKQEKAGIVSRETGDRAKQLDIVGRLIGDLRARLSSFTLPAS